MEVVRITLTFAKSFDILSFSLNLFGLDSIDSIDFRFKSELFLVWPVNLSDNLDSFIFSYM